MTAYVTDRPNPVNEVENMHEVENMNDVENMNVVERVIDGKNINGMEKRNQLENDPIPRNNIHEHITPPKISHIEGIPNNNRNVLAEITNDGEPCCSKSVNLKELIPLPKAGPRKNETSNRRKSVSAILTVTPVRDALSEEKHKTIAAKKKQVFPERKKEKRKTEKIKE
ncbi:hypothetical protein JTB14_038295 [Gonioctena quinquepunctata]|nr:hypothetical protein JTB14_038295 [Gonioctena quinquepunctata]